MRKAYCALEVIASASSRIIILCAFSGTLTFYYAKDLIFSRTTSIPLSSDAFNSQTAVLRQSPSNSLAKHIILVVFPQPGGPTNMIFGIFPYVAIARSCKIACSFPTTSLRYVGLYFSTQGISYPAI